MFCQLLYIFLVKAGYLFPMPQCSLWCVQMMGYIKALRTCLLVDISPHIIIIIIQSCLEASNTQNACQVYSVECESIPTIILYAIYWAVCYQLTDF